MKIKKMYQGTVPENKILNTYSDSQTDVYSCDAINKNTKGLKYYINLDDGTDLNDIIDCGTYRSTSTAHTSTMTNVPNGVTGGFTMYVSSYTSTSSNNQYRRQEIIQSSNTYIRHTSNGGSTWTAWRCSDNVYSTTEQMIGTYLSQPLYRKVYTSLNFGTLSGSWKTFTTAPSNLETLVNIYGTDTSNNRPYPRYEGSDYYILFDINGGNIRVKGEGYDNASLNLVVEYTKTTD